MGFVDLNTSAKLSPRDGVSAIYLHSDRMSFSKIELKKGSFFPEHLHESEQWTYVIQGKLEFNIYDEIKILEPGMAAFVPSNEVHSAVALEDTEIISCFSPMRVER